MGSRAALLLVVALCTVTGCSLHSSGKQAVRAGPPPVSLAGKECESRLQATDARAVDELHSISLETVEIRDARARVREARRRLRETKRELEPVLAARARFQAFLAAHPETYLPPDLYQSYLSLRASYQEAQAQARPVFRVYERQRDEYNASAKTNNRLVRERRVHVKRQAKLAKAYEHERNGCLETAGLLSRGQETERLGSLETALAAAVTGTIAQPTVTVACHDPAEWRSLVDSRPGTETLGVVQPSAPHVIHLSPQVCYPLHRLRCLEHRPDLSCVAASRGSRFPLCAPRAQETVEAVEVLAHEAFHVTGVRDEREAQCSALQELAAVAGALGFSREDGNAIAYYLWRFPDVAKDYRSDECRDGGALDRHPESSAFPS